MKLLNKLRDLRNERTYPTETQPTGYSSETMGLGTVTVHDIARLHAEMDVYEHLYQQRKDH